MQMLLCQCNYALNLQNPQRTLKEPSKNPQRTPKRTLKEPLKIHQITPKDPQSTLQEPQMFPFRAKALVVLVFIHLV